MRKRKTWSFALLGALLSRQGRHSLEPGPEAQKLGPMNLRAQNFGPRKPGPPKLRPKTSKSSKLM